LGELALGGLCSANVADRKQREIICLRGAAPELSHCADLGSRHEPILLSGRAMRINAVVLNASLSTRNQPEGHKLRTPTVDSLVRVPSAEGPDFRSNRLKRLFFRATWGFFSCKRPHVLRILVDALMEVGATILCMHAPTRVVRKNSLILPHAASGLAWNCALRPSRKHIAQACACRCGSGMLWLKLLPGLVFIASEKCSTILYDPNRILQVRTWILLSGAKWRNLMSGDELAEICFAARPVLWAVAIIAVILVAALVILRLYGHLSVAQPRLAWGSL